MRQRILALVVIGVLTLSGCRAYYGNERSEEISASQVVGTWVAESGEGDSSTIEFARGGTVTVVGLPIDPTADHGEADWSATRIDGAGTWSIEETDVSTWQVDLVLDGSTRPALMAITTDEEGLRLVLPVGDPDMKARVTFMRQD